jgi:membrane protein
MIPNKQQIREYLENKILRQHPTTRLGRIRLAVMRISYTVIRDLSEGQLTLRAMSLVYTTLLSLIPLLVVSFSVLKAFGVHKEVEPMLFDFLGHMGPQGIEIGERIMGFVDNVKVGVLGSVGLAVLFYTVISLLQKIERSFNHIWRVGEARHLSRRFSDYLSVILVGPVLMFTAIGMTASVKNTAIMEYLSTVMLLGDAIELFGRLIPYLLIIAAFGFVYVFMPNTKVRLGSALIGATLAGLLWEATSWAFASFVATSANYAAIYSSFAILVLFMIWLYLGWIILLVGADVAYYHQHPRILSSATACNCIEQRHSEQLAVQVMYLIGLHYHEGQPAWTTDDLANALNKPPEQISNILYTLSDAHLVCETSNSHTAWVPAREMDTIRLIDILRAARGAKTPITLPHGNLQTATSHVSERVEHALESALNNETLKDLVVRFPEQKTA